MKNLIVADNLIPAKIMNGGYNMEDRVFKIYAGLGGSFGGADYIGTYTFADYSEAEDFAYHEALDAYKMYEGSNGLLSYADCLDELKDELPDDGTLEDAAEEVYLNYVSDWIEFHAIEIEV